MSDVVLTGMGLTTWRGRGASRFWRELSGGGAPLAPGTAPAVALDAPALRARRDALVSGVAREALAQAGLAPDRGRWLVATVAQADDAAAAARPAPGGALPRTADRVVISHACASVGYALAWARTSLRAGAADHALVVGACVRTDHEVAGMAVARTLSRSHARPFDADRDGTVVGEGAGALVLERRDAAIRRGVVPQAAVAGLACRVGAGSGAALDEPVARACVAAALADAGDPPVGYVHAHATGTRQGDDAELLALAGLRGAGGRPIPVSSHKGLVGHLMHCSMFPGAVAAVGALRRRLAPGTPGLTAARTERGLRLLRDGEPCPGLDHVLVDGFGFGDNNAAIVLTHGDRGERQERR